MMPKFGPPMNASPFGGAFPRPQLRAPFQPSLRPVLPGSVPHKMPPRHDVAASKLAPVAAPKPATVTPPTSSALWRPVLPVGATCPPLLSAGQLRVGATGLTPLSNVGTPRPMQTTIRPLHNGVTPVRHAMAPSLNSVTPRKDAAAIVDPNVNRRVVVKNSGERMLSLESEFNGDFLVNGHPLLLNVDHPTKPNETGFRVWDAGIVMAKYIEFKKVEFPKQRVLELGCGSGITGISWALCGHDVVLSDRALIQERTDGNVLRNRAAIAAAGGSISFQVLDWTDLGNYQDDSFDCVLASDVIWSQTFIVPFLTALQRVTKESTRILMGHKVRSKELDTQFTDACLDMGFEVVEQIHPSDFLGDKYCLESVHIFVIRRSKKSAGPPAVGAAAEEHAAPAEKAAAEEHAAPAEKATAEEEHAAPAKEAAAEEQAAPAEEIATEEPTAPAEETLAGEKAIEETEPASEEQAAAATEEHAAPPTEEQAAPTTEEHAAPATEEQATPATEEEPVPVTEKQATAEEQPTEEKVIEEQASEEAVAKDAVAEESPEEKEQRPREGEEETVEQ
eukprot:GEMP01004300.1.p1 GENE.GEMP01004300.1~~GEMP01004300.1.p1  ORF type:complete len:612 (+),score=186.03 GEMP01004300.1:148-1836(+)